MSNGAGRPFVWPWKTTPIGRGFYLKACSRASAMASVGRANRRWNVEYVLVTNAPDTTAFFLRRVK